MADARFEDGAIKDGTFQDGASKPLNLVARDEGDLAVVSALVQDAVLTAADLRYIRSKRRFALLINRFRWEQGAVPGHERVRSLLVFDDVTVVQAQGVARDTPDLVLSLLSVNFAPAADGTGVVTLTFAGDGAVALSVEALEVSLKDVTKPYLAPSRRMPHHPD